MSQQSLLVRPAGPGDAGAISTVYAPYVTDGVATFELEPPDRDEVERRMLVQPLLPWLVAERLGGVVGYAYASAHRPRAAYRWTVEVSVYLHPAECGKGSGRALYAALLPALRELGYVSALAAITAPNPASDRLHESFGFAPLGVFREVGYKRGAWHDVTWWQLALQPAPESPRLPRSWSP